MKRYARWMTLAAMLLVGPIGCDTQKVDELKMRATNLEKDLADTQHRLTERDKEIAELRAKAEQNQANIDALTAEIVKLKAENKKLQQDVKKR